MTTVLVPQFAQPAIQPAQWARNGLYPDALMAVALANGYNHAAAFRLKEVARLSCPLASIPGAGVLAAAGSVDRWRCAWHSHPYAQAMFVQMVMAPTPLDPDGGPSTPPTVRFRASTASLTIGDAEMAMGPTAATVADTPAYFAAGRMILASGGALAVIPPDADMFGLVTQVDGGRIVSLSAWEFTIDHDADTSGGGPATFLEPSYAAGSPILDIQRQIMTESARSLWKAGAAHGWNWSADLQSAPRTRTSATAANLLDTSVTTVSAASPGPTLDLSFRSTVRRTTVPMVMKVRAKQSSGSGTVLLKSSAGTTLLTITVNSSTEQWWSGTVNLPASSAKYDVQFASNGTNTLSVYAVSLYQYEA